MQTRKHVPTAVAAIAAAALMAGGCDDGATATGNSGDRSATPGTSSSTKAPWQMPASPNYREIEPGLYVFAFPGKGEFVNSVWFGALSRTDQIPYLSLKSRSAIADSVPHYRIDHLSPTYGPYPDLPGIKSVVTSTWFNMVGMPSKIVDVEPGDKQTIKLQFTVCKSEGEQQYGFDLDVLGGKLQTFTEVKVPQLPSGLCDGVGKEVSSLA